MSRSPLRTTPTRGARAVENRLLTALPAGDLRRLAPTLHFAPLPLRRVLEHPGEPIESIVFPTSGFCSVLIALQDGRAVEVATVGCEGAIGVHAALADAPAVCTSLVQAEGAGFRMPLAAFRKELARGGAFAGLMTRYAHALTGSVMQAAACNAAHKLEQRLSRWLLMAHDRIGHAEFPLTQEFAAMMLGVTRPTVTVVAGTLQKAGLITYRRGRVRILERETLESASCECYRAMTDLLEHIYHPADDETMTR